MKNKLEEILQFCESYCFNEQKVIDFIEIK